MYGTAVSSDELMEIVQIPKDMVQIPFQSHSFRVDRATNQRPGDPRLRHASRGVDIQYFRFSDKTTRNKVMRAHLWIYAKSWGGGDGEGGTMGTDVTVTVYRVREGRGGGESPQLSIIHSSKEREPLPGRGRWITVDIRRLVIEWFKYPRENLGLVAQVYDSNLHQLVVTDPEEDGGGYIPFVEVHTTDGRKHRTKRTIGLNCIENSRENRCCRYPLTVDFEEFGWDWIIAPKRYEANYCSGECPFVFLQKYPHTHIVQQANPGGTAGPCCAPRKMSSISMLYFDNEFNIIHSLLPGMVVDRCGCS
ncbi:growth/differentiation factor 8 [Hetaerina americana]|uniref:growth/differentiation factor 8 n=1 Tax=Hetaerina americana TaxID=62018 RepID=UPI003A7F3AEE